MWRNLALAGPLCALLATTALAGCGGDGSDDTPQALEREDCAAPVVSNVVGRFLEALNRGDLEALNRIIAPPGTFEWYTVQAVRGRAPGERPQAGGRTTLIRYFARRHERGERMQLRSFQFNGSDDGLGHFQYRLLRSARDHPPAPYNGKGAVICTTGRDVIAVWSMATNRFPPLERTHQPNGVRRPH